MYPDSGCCQCSICDHWWLWVLVLVGPGEREEWLEPVREGKWEQVIQQKPARCTVNLQARNQCWGSWGWVAFPVLHLIRRENINKSSWEFLRQNLPSPVLRVRICYLVSSNKQHSHHPITLSWECTLSCPQYWLEHRQTFSRGTQVTGLDCSQ